MTTCKCPTCGAVLHISADAPKEHRKRRSIFRSDARQHFGQSVAPTFPQQRQGSTVNQAPGTTREVEQRRPEMPIDIATKALNSIGFGVATACASILSFAIWPDQVPWYTPFAVVLPAAGLAWFAVSLRPQDIVTFTEKLTRLDLDGDGKIGKKKPESENTRRVLVEESDGAIKIYDTPYTPKMWSFARAVLSGASFNEETANQHLGWGRRKWTVFRDMFFDRGGAVWKNKKHHQDGILLLGGGRAALRGCLPSPDGSSD